MITTKMSFSQYISNITAKAFKVINFLLEEIRYMNAGQRLDIGSLMKVDGE